MSKLDLDALDAQAAEPEWSIAPDDKVLFSRAILRQLIAAAHAARVWCQAV